MGIARSVNKGNQIEFQPGKKGTGCMFGSFQRPRPLLESSPRQAIVLPLVGQDRSECSRLISACTVSTHSAKCLPTARSTLLLGGKSLVWHSLKHFLRFFLFFITK